MTRAELPAGVPAESFGPRLRAILAMNAYAEENMRRPLDLEMEFSAGEGI
jgi:hypothetical protein